MPKTFTQNHLIKLFQRIGFKTLDTGTCQGIVMAWISSAACDKEDDFWDRNDWLFKKLIGEIPGDSEIDRLKGIFATFLQQATVDKKLDVDEGKLQDQTIETYLGMINKNIDDFVEYINLTLAIIASKKGIDLSKDEQSVINLLAFANTIELFQQPGKYDKEELFGLDDNSRSLGQQDSLFISQFTQSNILRKMEGLHEMQRKDYIFNDNELYDYLSALRDYLKYTTSKNITIPISIFSNMHAIGIRYDLNKDKWVFVDPNNMGEVMVSHIDIVKQLKSAFNIDKLSFFAFNINLFTAKNNQSKLDDLNKSNDSRIRNFIDTQQNIKDAATRVASTGETMLWYAARNGDVEFAEALIKENAPVVEFSEYPQARACTNGHVDIIKLFNKYNDKFDLNLKGKSNQPPIMYAIIEDQVVVLKELYRIKNDYDKNKHLEFAIARNRQGVVKYLVKTGVLPSINAIAIAANQNNSELFKFLLENQDITKDRLLLVDMLLENYASEEFLFEEKNREIVFGKFIFKFHPFENADTSDTLIEKCLCEGKIHLSKSLARIVYKDLNNLVDIKDDMTKLKHELTGYVLSAIFNEESPKRNYELLRQIRLMKEDNIDNFINQLSLLKIPAEPGTFFYNPNATLENLISKLGDYKDNRVKNAPPNI